MGWAAGSERGPSFVSLPPSRHGLNAPSPGTDHPPASCRCVGTVMWELHPSALGPNDGPFAIVGHSCALYPRLPGRDSDRGTPQSLSAVDACSWDAEGRWGGTSRGGDPQPRCGVSAGAQRCRCSLCAGPRGASSWEFRTGAPPARR